MIKIKSKIIIDKGIEFISQWKDSYGNYKIENFISRGKIIINKEITGCGFTSYCLENRHNLILISPRIALIQNKVEQFNKIIPDGCFYFNRVKPSVGKRRAKYKSRDELELELQSYLERCNKEDRPIKLLITYDSFWLLADILEQSFQCDISSTFDIAVDESHCIIKDIKMKEYRNQNTLTIFLDRVFQYDNVLFISATPISNYMQQIPQFQQNYVEYYQMEWPDKEVVSERPHNCKSASDAFNKIFDIFEKTKDPSGRNAFDYCPRADGSMTYSYEAVIYINSVGDIKRILKNYIKKAGLINVNDISVICADTDENRKILSDIDPKLTVMTSIPKRGEKHTTWTFATRTAFCGVDFYSTSASSFVVADYNVPCLALDVASDIPQIIGRQREKKNIFRNTLHIFYVQGKRTVSDEEFNERRKRILEESQDQIAIWESAPEKAKKTALENLNKIINDDPAGLYISTASGKPEINPLLLLDEQYSHDIQKNHKQWFIMSPGTSYLPYNPTVQVLKNELEQITSPRIKEDRIRRTFDYITNYPILKDEIFKMLYNEGYNDIAYYFCQLPLDRILALGFNTTRMDDEIKLRNSTLSINDLVAIQFPKGQTYTAKEVKVLLQDIFDNLGLKKIAKATDLPNYILCAVSHTRTGDVYRIL